MHIMIFPDRICLGDMFIKLSSLLKTGAVPQLVISLNVAIAKYKLYNALCAYIPVTMNSCVTPSNYNEI